MAENVMDVLRERGFIAQTVYEDDLYKMLGSEKVTFYVGFDPTADSLHIGHYIPIMAMAHMQRAGHRPIALMGGGTGLVGDPSGKSELRKMLTREDVNHNVECIKKQMSRFLDFSDDKALIVNNADWLTNLNYIDFLREVGVHFSVNRMLTAECYKQRMEKGLTFFEMGYMLLQGYDFLELNRKYGCVLQMGGDDQWSNMLGGVELIRKKEQKPAYCLTTSLLTTSEGKKMGKTEKGALWLDPNKTSVYDFYQYWRNIDDADVEKCLRLLTFIPMDEIRSLCAEGGAALNNAKKVLAYTLTAQVHGEEEAGKASQAAEALFGGGGDLSNIPTIALTPADIEATGLKVTDLLVMGKLSKSKSDARRLIEAGSVLIGDEKVTDVYAALSEAALSEGVVIKKGKKGFVRVVKA